MQQLASRKSNDKDLLKNKMVRTDVIRHLTALVAPDEATATEMWTSLSVRLEQADPGALCDLHKDLKKLSKLLESVPKKDMQGAPEADQDEYLAALKFERLTAEQEVELAFSIEAGLLAQERIDQSGKKGEALELTLMRDLRQLVRNGQSDKERFIKANIPLVRHWSKKLKFQGRGLSQQELLQEGMLGLIRAVEKFDYSAGYKFSTYAAYWLNNAMNRAIYDMGRTVRLPEEVEQDLLSLRRVTRELEQELNRLPNNEEIAKKMGIAVAKVIDLKVWEPRTISLNLPIGEGGNAELGDIVSDAKAGDEPEINAVDLRIDLKAAMNQLEDREKIILQARFFKSQTQQQVADQFGLTVRRIGQIERAALNKLQEIAPELSRHFGSGDDDA